MLPTPPLDDKRDVAATQASTPRRSRWKPCGAVAIAVIAVLVVPYLFSEGLLISCRSVTVRATGEADKKQDSQRYFGIWAKDNTAIRNIAVVEGTFSKSTWLSAWLYVVKAGAVEEENAFTVGRSPNRIGEPIWISMEITLALGEEQKPTGRRVLLGAAGHTRGGGRGGGDDGPVHNFTTLAKRVFPGKLSSGLKYILYVEGDREFNATREMSLEEFAAMNGGNYFVVIGQLE